MRCGCAWSVHDACVKVMCWREVVGELLIDMSQFEATGDRLGGLVTLSHVARVYHDDHRIEFRPWGMTRLWYRSNFPNHISCRIRSIKGGS